jgi:hypothetical protein
MTRAEQLAGFVDHSQIVQLECLRSGICGTKSRSLAALGARGAPTGDSFPFPSSITCWWLAPESSET